MEESLFDNWAKYITEILKSESDLAKQLVKHNYELGNIREYLIVNVLNRILPEIYEIGHGQIVDSNNQYSKEIDIIIARKDFPSLKQPNGSKIYLIESVLATIEVKSTLNHDKLFEAFENCYSISKLSINIVGGTLEKAAENLGLLKNKNGKYTHPRYLYWADYLDVFVRPINYIFGFKGLIDLTSFTDSINSWAVKVNGETGRFNMINLPALILGEKLYATYNAPPYQIEEDVMYLLGAEQYPIRLLIMHLLYTLGRKIPRNSDYYGIVYNHELYLKQMRPPGYLVGLFKYKAL